MAHFFCHLSPTVRVVGPNTRLNPSPHAIAPPSGRRSTLQLTSVSLPNLSLDRWPVACWHSLENAFEDWLRFEETNFQCRLLPDVKINDKRNDARSETRPNSVTSYIRFSYTMTRRAQVPRANSSETTGAWIQGDIDFAQKTVVKDKVGLCDASTHDVVSHYATRQSHFLQTLMHPIKQYQHKSCNSCWIF